MGEFVIRLAHEFGLEDPHGVGPDIGTGGRTRRRLRDVEGDHSQLNRAWADLFRPARRGRKE
jgi:hypothetical protein